jgi:hypothetical protein
MPFVPFVDHTFRYILIQLNWVVLAYNFNISKKVLIIYESCIGVFLLTALSFLLLPCISFYSCTCRVPTISVLNLATFPATQTCCSEDGDGVEFIDEEF